MTSLTSLTSRNAPDAELGQALDVAMAQVLFEEADAALYVAKQQGRNRAVLQPEA